MTNSLALMVIPITLLLSCGGKDEAQETTKARTESSMPDTAKPRKTQPVGDPEAIALLNTAQENMGKLTSYHAEADLENATGKGRLVGDFGDSSQQFTLERVDGGITRGIVIAGDSWFSIDDGKTWTADPGRKVNKLAGVITESVAPSSRLAERGSVESIGKEKLDGASVTHIRVGANPPIDIWVGEDPQAGKVIRKITVLVPMGDLQINTTAVFSDFNKKLKIVPPQ